jgi:hypothetical protein
MTKARREPFTLIPFPPFRVFALSTFRDSACQELADARQRDFCRSFSALPMTFATPRHISPPPRGLFHAERIGHFVEPQRLTTSPKSAILSGSPTVALRNSTPVKPPFIAILLPSMAVYLALFSPFATKLAAPANSGDFRCPQAVFG